MTGFDEYIFRGANFHDSAEEHYADSIAEKSRHPKIMGYEYERHPRGFLHVAQQVQYLRTHRDVEFADCLIRHDQPRLDGESTCNRNALQLAARHFMRIARRELGSQADPGQQCRYHHLYFGGWTELLHSQGQPDGLADPYPGIE